MKLKKILSAALAAVMAASVMSIGMVSVASAAEPEITYVSSLSENSKTATEFFNGLVTSGGCKVVSNTAPTTATTTDSTEEGKKADLSKLTMHLLASSNGGTITVNSKEGMTVGIYYAMGNSSSEHKAGALIVDKTNISTQTTTSTDTVYYYEKKLDGTTSVEFGSSVRLMVYAITITDTSVHEGGTVSLTVNHPENGTTNVTVAGQALEAGSSVTANADDAVVITATANAGYVADVVVGGKTVALVESKYEFNVNGNTDIVVTYDAEGAAKEVSSAVGSVSLTTDLGDVMDAPHAHYNNGDIVSGYFTVELNNAGHEEDEAYNIVKRPDQGSGCIQTGREESAKLKFTTDVPLKVTIPFASTGTTNISDVVILDESNSVIAHGTNKGTGATNLIVDNLPAGTYYIASPTVEHGAATGILNDKQEENGPSTRGARLTSVIFDNPTPILSSVGGTTNGSTVAVYVEGNDLYTISVIAKADVDGGTYSSIAQKTAVANIEETAGNTVYAGIQINPETVIKAEDIGGQAGDYVYANKISLGTAYTVDGNSALTTDYKDPKAQIQTITTVLE